MRVNPPHFSVFQLNNYYRSENPLVEVWDRIQRFSSESILSKEFVLDFHPENKDKLIKYVSTRINQAIEFRNASLNQTLLTKPLSLYYCMLNLMRAYIALDKEVEAKTSHGLCFKSANNILDSYAIISNGTFSQYLQIKGYSLDTKRIITLREALANIIELGKDLQSINDISIGFTPFAINAFQDGTINISILRNYEGIEEKWKLLFPLLAQDFEYCGDNILCTHNDLFKNLQNVITYINKIFLTELNRLTTNDVSIWYLFNSDKQQPLPRICYYHIAFFILSNIVRYEPDTLQETIIRNDEVYWLLNRLQFFGDRYYPQLIMNEICREPIYF